MTGFRRLLAVIFLAATLTACRGGTAAVVPPSAPPEPTVVVAPTEPPAAPTPTPPQPSPVPTLTPTAADPARLVPEIVAVYPHDPAAFTQGLVWAGDRLFESTGIGSVATSELRELDLETGGAIQTVALDPSYFGEGLALVEERLIQLTWQDGVAFIYDLATLNRTGGFRYEGEGWGLCFDGRELWMSDGSSRLVRRDPLTFAVVGEIEVTLEGGPVFLLNELECAGDSIYANVWKTDQILRIDPAGGQVTAVIDAAGLLPPFEKNELDEEQILNGIAYREDEGLFYLTGKEWGRMFAVVFVEDVGD